MAAATTAEKAAAVKTMFTELAPFISAYNSLDGKSATLTPATDIPGDLVAQMGNKVAICKAVFDQT